MAEMYTLKSEEQSQQLKLIAGEELKDEQQLFQAVINKLISHGINAGDVKKLQDAGIYSCNDLMMKTKENLAGIKGLSEVKLHEICQAAEKIVTFGYITGSDALLRKSLETVGGGIEMDDIGQSPSFSGDGDENDEGVGGDEVAEDDEGAADDEEVDEEDGEEDGGGGEEHADLIPIFVRQEDGGLQFVGNLVRGDCVGMDDFYDVSLHVDDIVAELGIQLGEDFFNDFEIQLNQDALDEGFFPVPFNFAATLEAISRIVISQ